jgi:MFS family permease
MSPIRRLLVESVGHAREFSPPARRFLLATALAFIAYGVASVLLNLYLIQGGYRESFVGRIVSLNALGLALLALPAGWLADRWGRRRTVILGLIVEGISMTARALTLSPALLSVSSFGAGAGQALFAVAAAPFLTEHSTPRERTHLFTAFFAIELVAAVVGNVIGGCVPALLVRLPVAFAPSLLFSYRLTLLIGAGLALAAALPLGRAHGLREETLVRGAEARAPDARPLFPIALNAFLLGTGAGFVIPFMNLYFARRFDCSSAQIGVIFAATQLTTAAATLLGPTLAKRWGKLEVATAMELMSLPFLITLGLERRLDVAVGVFMVRATLMQSGTPLLNAFIMEALPPSLRARSTSLNNTLWQAGWAASSTLAGFVIQRWGYAVPFGITACLYLVASLSFYAAFRRRGRTAGGEVTVGEAAAHGEGPAAD